MGQNPFGEEEEAVNLVIELEGHMHDDWEILGGY